MPERVQLRRAKGYRKPDGVIVVARPSKWGNPFTVRSAVESGFADEARTLCVEAFSSWLTNGRRSVWWFEAGRERFEAMRENLPQLAGKDLACWCPLDQPCHADVLLDLANQRFTTAPIDPNGEW